MKKIYIIIACMFLTVCNLVYAQNKQNPFTKEKGTKSAVETSPSKPFSMPTLKKIESATTPRPSEQKRTLPTHFEPKPADFNLTGLHILRDKTSDLPIFIEGKIEGLALPRNASIEDKSMAYLRHIKNITTIENPEQQFVITKVEKDELDQNHIRLQQIFRGIPIYGGEVLLHEKNQQIELFNGRYFPTPTIQNLSPQLNKADACNLALKDVATETTLATPNMAHKGWLRYEPTRAELVIYHLNENPRAARLVWHITVKPNFMERWEYFLDAHTGEILNKYDHTCSLVPRLGDANKKTTSCNGHHHHAAADALLPPTTANATDLNGATQQIRTFQDGSAYYLFDGSRTEMYNGNFSDPEGAIFTLDMQESNIQSPRYAEITSSNNTWNDRTAVSAHYNAGRSYEYFRNTHSRNSINGQGGNIISFIHIREDNGTEMDNAFWNGQYIFYGDGSQAFKPLAGALDVAGHELSHGVVSNTANLVYQGESGAINESMADIFGAMIDRDDWKMGEDVVRTTVFPSGALRDMQDPHNGGSSLQDDGWQPKHMSERYTGSQDNGGVHINSGIPNHAYYRFATAVGKDKAEKVFYRALANYLTRSSKFLDLRLAVVKAATDLYTTTEVNAAKAAFDAVGITDGTSTTTPPVLQTNPGQDYILSYDVTQTDPNRLYRSSTTGQNFLALTTKKMRHKPSVSDDGTFAIFVAEDKTLWEIELKDNNGNGTLDEFNRSADPVWENAAISKDGNHLAVTLAERDNKIWVYDFNREEWKNFSLYNPTTSSNGETTKEVQYADALEWDHTGQYVMYDAYNIQKGATQGEQIEFWDVGFMRAWDNTANNFSNGQVSKLFSSLPKDVSIGNPSFSKNSPNIIAFDYIDDAQSTYEVLAVNIETNKVVTIFQNTKLGYPNYSKNDSKLIFDTYGNNNQAIIAVINLQSDKITPSGTASGLIGDAQWGVWYAEGERNLNTPTQQIPELEGELRLSPNPFSSTLVLEATAKSRATGRLNLYDLLGRSVHQQDVNVSVGENRWELLLPTLPSGHYFLQLRLNGQQVSKKIMKL